MVASKLMRAANRLLGVGTAERGYPAIVAALCVENSKLPRSSESTLVAFGDSHHLIRRLIGGK